MSLSIIAHEVHPDEECHGYWVGPESRPGLPGQDDEVRMIEKVFVIRADCIAKYERDLGPADAYQYVPPMMIPSFGENTVAQLQDMGERHIHDDRWARRMREYKESSTLYQDIIRQAEQLSAIIKNKSQFGPAGQFQRNGYSHETNWRNWTDERARRTGKRKFFTS